MNWPRRKEILSHYVCGLVILLLFFSLLHFFVPFRPLNKLLALLGFLWPYSMVTPYLGERVQSQSYRYSFLRFAFFFCGFVEKKLPPSFLQRRKALALASLPIFFALFLMAISPVANPLCALLGSGLWFVFWEFKQKFKWPPSPPSLLD